MNTLLFPGLGLEFELNRVAFTIFGRGIYWYGVIIAVGFILAVLYGCRKAAPFGVDQDKVIDLLFFAVPAAIIGARAYYVIFYLDLYLDPDGSFNWGRAVAITDGGLAIYGGIIAAVLTAVIYCRVRKQPFWSYADCGAYGFLIGQLIGRWGNFVNIEAYGGTTTLPWRMCSESIAWYMKSHGYVDDAGYQAILSGSMGVHPTFFYESAWNFVGLILVYFMGKKRKFDGQCFLFYVFWYGLGRAWIEGMRTDSLYFFGLELFGMPIRTSQMLAIVSAAVAGAVLLYLLKRGNHDPEKMFVNRVAAARAAQEAESVGVAQEEPEEHDVAVSEPEAEKKEE